MEWTRCEAAIPSGPRAITQEITRRRADKKNIIKELTTGILEVTTINSGNALLYFI